ncbi:BtrH N-terminal domain-containing protein [Streptomyces sp. NBC_01167]|uniref:BtrH N-terminal domain-containing protein n=1 Tax=Streptomyces sp. NBC_01167 TaxID=2903756 RepID=UPI003864BB09|nr:BtrH N-terminal domain-containing protein [Streptomyces sp. NBC_01167]
MSADARSAGRPRGAMLEGFRPVPGVHCETTMLNNMLRYAGLDVSEALIFGLGRGIDAQFFPPPPHTGIPPMLTGRVEPGRIAADACAAMGLTLVTTQDADDAGAHARAVAALSAGSVVGVTVDIFHLDYFASQAHFSAHCIALHGLDDSTAYVADTSQQGGAQQLPLESFTRARASDEGFMPSPRLHWHLDDSPGPLPGGAAALAPRMWPAILGAAGHYLDRGRGDDRGILALRRAAEELPGWQQLSRSDVVIPEIARFWRFAGTGGTNFRGLYGEFLAEAQAMTGDAELLPSLTRFEAVVSAWTGLIDHLTGYPEASSRTAHLKDASARLHSIADAEEAAFGELAELARDRVGAERVT